MSAQLLKFLFSTEQEILQIINYVTQSLNDGKIAAACLLDVQKACDTVDHSILLSKLENAGIRGLILKWFKSNLLDRKQRAFWLVQL